MVTRYQNLKSLDLRFCNWGITNETVTTIIRRLKQSLEELDLYRSDVTLDKLLELKLMPKLKVLNCFHLKEDEIATLKNNLPHMTINEKDVSVGWADGTYEPEDGFWEIEAKQLKIFDREKLSRGPIFQFDDDDDDSFG